MIISLKSQISNSKSQVFTVTFFTLIFAFCIITNAYAHRVNIYAYAENGMVHSKSYFSDGKKCKNCVLEVFDKKSGTKLLEGKTDEEGRFSFKIPKATSLKLALRDGKGHRAEFTLSEDEVREAMGVKQPHGPSSVKAPPKLEGDISISEIEAIVEGALDKRLQPMMRMLVELEKEARKPGITEIIGGIGYIIGILGIIAYFKAKKIRKD